MTTIKDLYEWAVKRHVENLPVGLQFQDDGGAYSGDTFSDMGADYEISASIEESGVDKYVLLA